MSLYGRPFVLIRLTSKPAPDVLPERMQVAALFNYREKTHEILSVEDDPFVFNQRFLLLPGRDSGSRGAP
jgi:hypothetical protein